MKDAVQLREPTLSLPSYAPLVRLSAGVGSAGQKTWNLRRPITLIGSRRPAHIVLHDKDVSSAHCVIVNTGHEVLLKDLHTSAGTKRQREVIDLIVLKDGDVLTIGGTSLQVAIQVPQNPSDDSACGMKYLDPCKFGGRVVLRLLGTTTEWPIEDAVALLGSHQNAAVCLDHDDISPRHAVLFKFQNRPAVFDISMKSGIWMNGQRASLAMVKDGDGLTIGPFGVTVAYNFPSPMSVAAAIPPASATLGGGSSLAGSDGANPPGATPPSTATSGRLSDLDAALSDLERNLTDAWEQLNNWDMPADAGATATTLTPAQSSPTQPAPTQSTQPPTPASTEPAQAASNSADLSALNAELEAKEAAIRGRLHDVTRFHEQIVEREKDVAAETARLQEERDALAVAQREFAVKEADLARRLQEVQSRENATAQRLTRMRTANCPHCGKPVNLNAARA